MSSDGLRPGETELNDDGPQLPIAVAPEPAIAEPEPEPEPVAAAPAPAAAAPETTEQEAEAEPEGDDPDVKPKGLVPELSWTRRRLKDARDRANAYERDLREGRLVKAEPKPAVNVQEQERVELQATAERLRLVTTDTDGKQVWDLDAAKRVKDEINSGANAAVAPIRQTLLMQSAQANVNTAVEFAKAAKMPEPALEFVRAKYVEMLGQPNGAAMLADPKVAETIWYNAIGEATARGLLTPSASPVKADPKPAVVAPATGRRNGTAAVQLSASAQKAYKDNNLDPGKAYTARTQVQPDAQGAYSLED